MILDNIKNSGGTFADIPENIVFIFKTKLPSIHI